MTLKNQNRSALKLLPALCAAATLAGAISLSAQASSHREAPFITRTPKVDGTDFYMFRSYETGRAGFVTLVANYQPLQDAYGGPNYFEMDPDALYEIHVDNNGDANEDISFQFRFQNNNKNTTLNIGGKDVAIPLVQSGPISGVNPGTQNVNETFTLNVVRGNRRSGNRQAVTNAADGSSTFNKPIDNIGKKTIADYAGYAAQFVYNVAIPGCTVPGSRVFVGQRKDPFIVNLGETFDLINIKVPATEFDATAESLETDSLADKNVTSLILEVPIACLTNGTEPVIGGWTTASLRQGRLIDPSPKDLKDGRGSASKEGGSWAQVSRLGSPLVNEVVIGLKDKDKFNASKPASDGQFAEYVTNPTLPALIELLFKAATNGAVVAPTNFPRTDLVAAFLTGVPGLNQPANVKASEMLRLNTSIPPTPKGSQNRLGVVGGDNAGFPNGRRPGDDVVDIELRVAMGLLCTIPGVNTAVGCKASDAPAGGIHFTDGALANDSFTDAAFPYIRTPIAGSPNGVSD